MHLASAKKDLGRLVRRNGKAQVGVRGDARRVTHLARAAQDFHDFAEYFFPDTRGGHIQVRDPLGKNSLSSGAQAYAETPITSRFAVTGQTRWQVPRLEVAPD